MQTVSWTWFLLTFLSPNISAKIVSHVFEIKYFEGSPDGVYKERILGINGQFPGPTIYADVGDRIQIDVINQIQDGQNTSIHWHGFHQRNNYCEDGTSLISQCPLRFNNVQRYSFIADNAGTYWYHSHVNSQYTEGLWGCLIVKNNPEIYTYDEEIIVTLNDWHHRTAYENEEWHVSPASAGIPPYPDSGMINGLGRYPCDYAALQNRSCNPDIQKRQVFEVQRNKTYRVRVINTSGMAMFNFSIDGHQLQPIEADGVDIRKTRPIDIASIASGQRYSFLIRTDGSLDRYLVRANIRTESLPFNDYVPNINKYSEALLGDVTAILQYSLESNSSDLLRLSTEPHSYLITIPLMTQSDQIHLDETLLGSFDGIPAPNHVDQEIHLEAGFFVDHEDIRRGAFNETPFKLPSDKPLLNYLKNGEDFPPESFSIELGYMNVVNLVINNPLYRPHPLHLHGHHFWVLGTGAWNDGNYDPSRHNLTLTGVKRDTVVIQEKSWAVIRFIADNPGIWPFHCHIDWHNLSGMAVMFIEAKEKAMSEIEITEESIRICNMWK